MEYGGFSFTQENIQKVLGTADGRKLLSLLKKDGGAALRQAGDAIRRGDHAAAEAILSPIMNSPEARELIARINQS